MLIPVSIPVFSTVPEKWKMQLRQQAHNVLEALPYIVERGCYEVSLGLLMISSLALLRSSVTQIGRMKLMLS
jgi:hypothetical protein